MSKLYDQYLADRASNGGRTTSNVDSFLTSLGNKESGGNYTALGPVITGGSYQGDRAYGKYQIMGNNIPSWTSQYLGKSLTPQQFLNDPQSQDAVMKARATALYNQYGNWSDVASIHFSGRPLAQAGNASDQLGTTTPKYVSDVVASLGGNTGGSSLYQKYLADKNPVTPTPDQGIFSKIGGAISNYAQASANTVNTLGNAILHPIDTLKKAPDLFTTPYLAGINKAAESNLQFWEPGVANKVASITGIISGLAQSAFSPITGIFNIAENTPGLKQVADAINIPFSATGFVGSFATGKVVDWLPISQEAKDVIKKPLQEVGSLAAQMVLGGKIMEKVSTLTGQGKEITPEVATKIVEEAKSETASHPAVADTQTTPLYEKFKQSTPTSNISPDLQTLAQEAQKYKSAEEFVKAQTNAYHATTEKVAKSIESEGFRSMLGERSAGLTKGEGVWLYPKEGVGGGSKGGLDSAQGYVENFLGAEGKKGVVIETGVRGKVLQLTDKQDVQALAGDKNYIEGLRAKGYVGITGKELGQHQTFIFEPSAIKTKSQLTDLWNKANTKSEVAPTDTMGTTPSGLGKSIEQKAIEANLTTKFDKVAGYDASTIKEQSRIFTDTANKGVDELRAVVRGDKPLPEGAKGFPFVVSMEDYIKQHPELNKNGELSYELANSPLVKSASEAGSELGLGQNRTQDSFTKKVEEIKKAREARAKGSPEKTASIRKQAGESLNKINLSSEDLGKIEKFIQNNIC